MLPTAESVRRVAAQEKLGLEHQRRRRCAELLVGWERDDEAGPLWSIEATVDGRPVPGDGASIGGKEGAIVDAPTIDGTRGAHLRARRPVLVKAGSVITARWHA